MVKIVLIIAISVVSAAAEIRVYGFASVGEAPFQPSYDMGGSGPLPQFGVDMEFGATYLSPYSKFSIGKYNHGLMIEKYLGIQIGLPVFQIKPSITFGVGVQSFNRKRFTQGNEYTLIRETHTPFGFGARMDVMGKLYGEWDWRINGYPWWKIEIGYRLF